MTKCRALKLPVLGGLGIAALAAGFLSDSEWRWALVSVTLSCLLACYAWSATLPR